MSSGSSLAVRGLLAVALLVGFYALAIAVAGALLYVPYAEVVYLNRIHLKLTLACIAGAGIVLWSILPRPDRFEPPGPELKPSEHPEFFDIIAKIAAATSQAPPAHVYLTLEVNAWVTERGGIMGFGSQRVMGIGLPLLQGLSVDEMRAVIAHEFGHYVQGDTRLGPWIYKTRTAIARSLANLDEDNWIRLPFVAYAKLFLRITSSVSRQQEYAADAVAARIAGGDALSSGLKKLDSVSAAFDGFWRQEYVPVLQADRRAPLADGFAAFLASPRIASRLAEISAEALVETDPSPYDSHPSTAGRCAALDARNESAGLRDPRPSTVLLNRLDDIEREVLMACVAADVGRSQPVDWKSVPERVWVQQWRSRVAEQAGAFADFKVADLATLAGDPSLIARKMKFQAGYLPGDEERRQIAIRLLGTALGVALHHGGWTVLGAIAEPLTFHKAGETIEPISLVATLADDESARGEWAVRAQRLQIESLSLSVSPLTASIP